MPCTPKREESLIARCSTRVHSCFRSISGSSSVFEKQASCSPCRCHSTSVAKQPAWRYAVSKTLSTPAAWPNRVFPVRAGTAVLLPSVQPLGAGAGTIFAIAHSSSTTAADRRTGSSHPSIRPLHALPGYAASQRSRTWPRNWYASTCN